MDNVILWIKSNKDVVDAYRKTKHDCNYHHRTDNDFLMFLLEAATNVLSIVHQFSPQISCSPQNHEDTAPETIVTKECDINLEKLDKQLRINIVCPDLEEQTSTSAPTKSPEHLPDSSSSSSALQDISNHVNELESVLESLNKSCPSPLPSVSNMRPLTSRSFLDNFKPPALPSTPSRDMTSLPHTTQSRDISSISHISHENVGFQKFKTPNIVISKRSFNNSTGSSPNVTISAESQLNLLGREKKQPESVTSQIGCKTTVVTSQIGCSINTTVATPTPIKPTPVSHKSPEQPRGDKNPEPRDHKCPTPEQDKEMDLDVVSMNTEPHDQTEEQSVNSLKRKADCLDTSLNDRENDRKSPGPGPSTSESPVPDGGGGSATGGGGGENTAGGSTTLSSAGATELPADPVIKEEPLTSPDHNHPECGEMKIPTESELTQQLMSVIQSTLTQHQLQTINAAQTSNITCHECGLIFANEINLHRHMLTHTEPDKSSADQYNCPTCAFKTPRKQTLVKHINTVHSRDRSSGILYCDQCEYKTPTKSHLRNHMLAHSGNRQYQCPHCTYNSNFSNALTRHMTMHSRELFESKLGNMKP